MNEEYITLELTPEDEEYIDLLLDESEIEIELSMEDECGGDINFNNGVISIR